MYISLNVYHFTKYLILLTTKSILARDPEYELVHEHTRTYVCTTYSIDNLSYELSYDIFKSPSIQIMDIMVAYRRIQNLQYKSFDQSDHLIKTFDRNLIISPLILRCPTPVLGGTYAKISIFISKVSSIFSI